MRPYQLKHRQLNEPRLKKCAEAITISLCVAVSSLCTGLLTNTATAAELEIQRETSAFTNLVMSDGAVRIVLDYDPETPQNYGLDAGDENNHLKYKIYYDYELFVEDSSYGTRFSGVTLDDLDNDGTAEVIVQSYSGGAHCCTNHTIYSWQGEQFTVVETGYLNSLGGRFMDLNNDGYKEFVAADDTFLYRFAAYADSYAPPLIYTFTDGQLRENTRNFPEYLRERIAQMESTFHNLDELEGRNGRLAGYVATKALIGEYDDAWQYMLQHHNSDSDWGIEIHSDSPVPGLAVDYPASLQMFLENRGYTEGQ